MSLYARDGRDCKARVGVASQVFEWHSTRPALTTPAPALRIDGAAVTPVALAPTALTIASVRDGRRELVTNAGTAPPAGLSGFRGKAWLLSTSDAHEVRVTSWTAGSAGPPIVPTVLRISEPLAWEPVLGTATLVWACYQWVIPTAVVATRRQNILWTVDYQTRLGSGLTAEPHRESGLLQVVHQPFSTGVTSRDVSEGLRSIGASAGADQEGWGAQLADSEEFIIAWLRSQLADRGLTEDDVPAPQSLRRAHVCLAGAQALLLTDPEASATLEEKGREALKLAMDRIWLDLDHDGQPDDGEVLQTGGPRRNDFRGSTSTGSSTWSVGRVL